MRDDTRIPLVPSLWGQLEIPVVTSTETVTKGAKISTRRAAKSFHCFKKKSPASDPATALGGNVPAESDVQVADDVSDVEKGRSTSVSPLRRPCAVAMQRFELEAPPEIDRGNRVPLAVPSLGTLQVHAIKTPPPPPPPPHQHRPHHGQ
jgi:hypothetical protein